MLNLMLQGIQLDRIRQAPVAHDCIGAEAERACGSDQAIAPVAKTVAIAFDGHGRPRDQMIRLLEVGDAREVHV